MGIRRHLSGLSANHARSGFGLTQSHGSGAVGTSVFEPELLILLLTSGMESNPAPGVTIMGADNWRTCPQCEKLSKDTRNAKIEKANKQYGKISVDEFRAAIAEAERPVKIEESLREDYEQGIDDHVTYCVSFRASCSACGFKFHFSHEASTQPQEGER